MGEGEPESEPKQDDLSKLCKSGHCKILTAFHTNKLVH